jgi:hypothetical protein
MKEIIDFTVFKKDMLDKCKLKNAKRRFKESGDIGKLVTIFKETR